MSKIALGGIWDSWSLPRRTRCERWTQVIIGKDNSIGSSLKFTSWMDVLQGRFPIYWKVIVFSPIWIIKRNWTVPRDSQVVDAAICWPRWSAELEQETRTRRNVVQAIGLMMTSQTIATTTPMNIIQKWLIYLIDQINSTITNRWGEDHVGNKGAWVMSWFIVTIGGSLRIQSKAD